MRENSYRMRTNSNRLPSKSGRIRANYDRLRAYSSRIPPDGRQTHTAKVVLSEVATVNLCLPTGPSAPVRFRGQAVSARDILLSWGVPLEPNGIIRYYYIRTYNSITGQQTNNLVNKSTVMQSFPGMGWSHFISNLKPYRNYTFTVQAVTVSPGDYANCTVMTQEGGN